MRAKLLPILVVAGLLGALALAALPQRSAIAQCGGRGQTPCPPEKKRHTETPVPTSTFTPTAVPSNTPTKTSVPTSTFTATTVPTATPTPPGFPLFPFLPGGDGSSSPPFGFPDWGGFIWFFGLLLGLLIGGFIWFRNGPGRPGEERGALNAYVPPPDNDLPAVQYPPDPDMPAGTNPPDPDMPAGNNPPEPDMPAGVNPPDPDMPAGE